jgi:hypothetical protein
LIPPDSKMSAIVFKLAGEKVHGIKTSEGIFLSVYDFINVVCDKNGMYAVQVWILVKNQFKYSMNATVARLRGLPKKTRKPTPVMTMGELAVLIDGLGKRVSVRFDFHRHFRDAFALFKSGHMSMFQEIRAQPWFAAPVPNAPVSGPPAPPAQEPEVEAVGAKRMRDHDEVLFNLELQERQLAIQERQVTIQERIFALRQKAGVI